MKQRVAIARALANSPSVLLMDEPFGALDAQTREILQEEMVRIWQRERKTVVVVTHSISESLFLADRIVVMATKPGTIKTVIDVDLPHPRERTEPGFIALEREVSTWSARRSTSSASCESGRSCASNAPIAKRPPEA